MMRTTLLQLLLLLLSTSTVVLATHDVTHRKLYRGLAGRVAPFEYLVQFTDTTNLNDALEALGNRHHCQVEYKYTELVQAAALSNVSKELLDELLEDESVVLVEENHLHEQEPLFHDPPTRNLRSGVSPSSRSSVENGNFESTNVVDDDDHDSKRRNLQFEGVAVIAYILDSGLYLEHDDLEGISECGYNAFTPFADTPDCTDETGSGTAVASVVGGRSLGIANDVLLVGVKITSSLGRGNFAQLLAGIEYVMRQHRLDRARPKLISLSVSATSLGFLAGSVVNLAVTRGVPVIVGSGEGLAAGVDACDINPAAADAAITVGVVNDANRTWFRGNFGDCLDLFANAVGIEVATTTSPSATGTASGSAIAAGLASGAAAVYLKDDDFLTPTGIWEVMRRDSYKDVVRGIGSTGSPNRLLNLDDLPFGIRCLLDAEELRDAVDDYLVDSSNETRVARAFGHPIGEWCVDDVDDFSFLFDSFLPRNPLAGAGYLNFNEDISQWNTSSATTMEAMFRGAQLYNFPLNDWDVSRVTRMNAMFNENLEFNQPLDNWDVSSVVNFDSMFLRAEIFNQPLPWNTESARITKNMFKDAISFNQPLAWNTENVTDMFGMFSGATLFDQASVASWDVSNVLDVGQMFLDTSLDQDLCVWGNLLGNETVVLDMFQGTNCLLQLDPNLTATPPGPFCANCSAVP